MLKKVMVGWFSADLSSHRGRSHPFENPRDFAAAANPVAKVVLETNTQLAARLLQAHESVAAKATGLAPHFTAGLSQASVFTNIVLRQVIEQLLLVACATS